MFIQVGTVETKKEYQGQGLSRKLIERVIEEYKERCDGFYLYANDTVKEFYPKFGFEKGYEYVHTKHNYRVQEQYLAIPMKDCSEQDKQQFYNYIKHLYPNERLVVNDYGLLRFWTNSLNEVFYIKELSCYVGARIKNNKLLIKQILSDHRVTVTEVIKAFSSQADEIILGFTPLEQEGFTIQRLIEEDTTYFYIGKQLEVIKESRLRFPIYSHA